MTNRERTGRLIAAAITFGSRPPVHHGLVIACAVFVLVIAQTAASGGPLVGYDARAYWTAAALDDPYASTLAGGFGGEGGLYEYKYPPPLAQLLFVVHWLPWPVFLGLWTAILLAALALQAGRLLLPTLFFPPVLGELWLGNINLLVGLMIVIGFRWPAAWSFVLLTKITPGVGLIWFAVRREWRPLAVALLTTGMVAGVSYLLAPDLWVDFVAALSTQMDASISAAGQAIPLPLPLRLAIAAALVAWGGRTDRRWTVPIAAVIAIPFSWWNALALAVAVIPLTVSEAAPRLTRWAGRPVAQPSRTPEAPSPESAVP